MRSKYVVIPVIAALIAGNSVSFCHGQPPATPASSEERKRDGRWEEIDQRLLFLMVRLANVESSLDAVQAAIGKISGQRTASRNAAKRAELGNELMDRQGGGPMKWTEFYGRTAERFFYHPIDGNTSYHTATVLSQQGAWADNKVGGGVPSSQGTPAHQRPPQFDYIYRANENAKARAEAEAAELKGKLDALLERRQRLEAEQNGLWCEVAFRAVSRFDLARKPAYRFEPRIIEGKGDADRHAEIMKAAAGFMARAISLVDEAQKDQPRALTAIKGEISEARKRLDDAWLRQDVTYSDLNTTTGKFFALAKRLDDVAANLSESYLIANEGEQAKDEQRKEMFRALLQESLVSYAQIILALDEMSNLLTQDFDFKPDVDKPIAIAALPVATLPALLASSSPATVETVVTDTGATQDNHPSGSVLTGLLNFTPAQERLLRPGLIGLIYPKSSNAPRANLMAFPPLSEFGEPLPDKGPIFVPTLNPWHYPNFSVGVVFGYLKIEEPGDYGFVSTNDNDFNEFLVKDRVVCRYRDQDAEVTKIALERGYVSVMSIGHYNGGGGVRVTWQRPGSKVTENIPPRLLFHFPPNVKLPPGGPIPFPGQPSAPPPQK